jgi:hypothetical protein
LSMMQAHLVGFKTAVLLLLLLFLLFLLCGL